MQVVYEIGSPLEDLMNELFDEWGSGKFGLSPYNFQIKEDFIRFGFPCIGCDDPIPYRSEHKDDALIIYYDITSGNKFGSAGNSVRFDILPETKRIIFDYDGMDVIDVRSGKKMRDLTEEEFLMHFFPKMNGLRKLY